MPPSPPRALTVALVSDWFAPRRGGIESHILGLGRALGAAGATVRALTAQPSAKTDLFAVEPVSIAHLPVFDLALPWGLVRVMEGALARIQPDVVHVHASIIAPASIAGVVAAQRLGLPVVLTAHSDVAAVSPLLSAFAGWLRPRLERVVLSAVSARIAGQLQPLSPNRAVVVLSNGFDGGFWGADTTPEVPQGRFHMVSAMRLERKKRPQVLGRLRTEVARATGLPVDLTVAGEGPWRRALSQQIEAPGWLGPADLRALYRRAHAFVLPSRVESFGIAALEARAAGLPVIGRAGTGLSEFITEGVDGFLCETDAAMAQAATRLATDRALWAQMSGPRRELLRFDWPRVAQHHLDIYAQAQLLRQ